MHMTHSAEMTALQATHSAEMAALQAAISDEIESLQAAMDKEVKSLHRTKQEEVRALAAAGDRKIVALCMATDIEIADLQAVMGDEMEALKAAMDEELSAGYSRQEVGTDQAGKEVAEVLMAKYEDMEALSSAHEKIQALRNALDDSRAQGTTMQRLNKVQRATILSLREQLQQHLPPSLERKHERAQPGTARKQKELKLAFQTFQDVIADVHAASPTGHSLNAGETGDGAGTL